MTLLKIILFVGLSLACSEENPTAAEDTSVAIDAGADPQDSDISMAEDLIIDQLSDNEEEELVEVVEDDDELVIIEIEEDDIVTPEDQPPPFEQDYEDQELSLELQIDNANAPFKDPNNANYSKLKKRIPDFATKLDQCINFYRGIFSAHTKDSEQCMDLEERMSKNKFRLAKRCVRLNFQENLSDQATDRLERVLPRSIERINRQYRKASITSCNLGAIPDQDSVNYVFNGSAEIAELDGKWGVKPGSEIPGWSVRFYDKEKGVVEKKGLLELQSNSLYRKSYVGSKDKYYMELDSHCAKGYTCPTTNVSIRQKIIVDKKSDFALNFEARMRNNDPLDNAIEIKFYKKGTKLKDRQALSGFEVVTDSSNVLSIEATRSIPVSTKWELYATDLGVVEPGEYFLEINEIGKPNQLGTLIDNISIKQD